MTIDDLLKMYRYETGSEPGQYLSMPEKLKGIPSTAYKRALADGWLHSPCGKKWVSENIKVSDDADDFDRSL